MTKILSSDRLHDDEWQEFGDERIEVAHAVIADLETLRSDGHRMRAAGLRLALAVGGDVAPEDYADVLDRVEMVAIHFSKIADGRGFSSARELRERWGFAGTLRAAGHFMPDQMAYLARVGFDAWELPDNPARHETYRLELRRFTTAYQALPGDSRLAISYRV